MTGCLGRTGGVGVAAADQLRLGDRLRLLTATTRNTGPRSMAPPQIEQRRSTAQISVRDVLVAANAGAPFTHGVIAGTG